METSDAKISDLLEQGWAGIPQVRGSFQVWNWAHDGINGACAVGAICFAVDPTKHITSMTEAEELVPQLQNRVTYDRDPGWPITESIGSFLVELNDFRRDTPETILASLRERGL